MLNEDKVNDVLAHFGIPGMRWGHRKTRTSTGSTKKTNVSDDAVKKAVNKSKSIHELTNEELKNTITRMQLEQQYKLLSQKEVSTGRKFITDLLTTTGQSVAKVYATKYAIKGMDALIANMTKK